MIKTLKSEESKDPYTQEDLEKNEITQREKKALRYLLLHDHLSFMRWSMRNRLGFKIMVDKFHHILCDAIEKVFEGEINRLIINIPPGYSKTEMAVIGIIARGLAINPSSRFLHLSFSDDLVLVNSGAAKEVIESDEYQELFPMELKSDSKGKKIWTNKQQGGLVCASAGGTITGFRAGQVGEGFTGALLIDDPIKPDDAYSKVKRDAINNRFTNTFKSRLMNKDVPIIMIMQRIHEDDPTGFLLRGGDGDMWHHLVLPAEILPEDEREPYPEEYTHGIEMKYDLPSGALWPYKYSLENIAKMRAADPYTTASQYDQRPSPMGGGMFKEEWWQFYNFDTPRNPEYKFITADTAQKTKEINDFSVFQCWGKEGDKIYLLDQIRGKWEAPELEMASKSFIRKHYGTGHETSGRLRSIGIEDKSSGTGLIQTLQRWREITLNIIPIQRNRDKVSRAYDFIPFISTGRVVIPQNAPFTSEYLLEFSRFTPTMTHKHDDMIDPTLDAIQTELAPAQKQSGSW